VSFAAITLCVTSQRVFIVVVYFVIDSVRKLLTTPPYLFHSKITNMATGRVFVVVFNKIQVLKEVGLILKFETF
jgi:enhancing lycopene biosynthesis protein 2